MKHDAISRKLLAIASIVLLGVCTSQGISFSVQQFTASSPESFDWTRSNTYQWTAKAKVVNDSDDNIEVTSITFQLWERDPGPDDWIKTRAQSYTRVVPCNTTAYLDFGPVAVSHDEWIDSAEGSIAALEFYSIIVMQNYRVVSHCHNSPDSGSTLTLCLCGFAAIALVARRRTEPA